MTKNDEPVNLIEILKLRGNVTDQGITFINGAKIEKFVSYQELYQNALGILHELQTRGIERGSELVFQIDDNETFLNIFWACILGGIIAVPITTGIADEYKMKLFKVMEVLHKPVLITTSKFAASYKKFVQDMSLSTRFHEIEQCAILVEDLSQGQRPGDICDLPPDHVAFIQFSSGSTGDPKGVTLSHDNLVVNTKDNNAFLKTGPADSMISWLPLTHDLGLIAVHISGVAAGINQFLMPTSLFIKQPSLWIKKTHEHRVTQAYSPNFGYKHLLDFWDRPSPNELDLSCVRVILNGAEPISVELHDTFMNELGVYGLKPGAMIAVYGLAEATVGVSGSLVGDNFLSHCVSRDFLKVGQVVRDMAVGSPGSMVFADEGFRTSHCKVRICDDHGQVVGENMVGHIQISGRNVTKGYYNNPEATKKVMTADGWLNTGDLGFMRNDRLVVTGRAKDIIFVNGQNFYPHDIERITETVEGIELGKVAACGVFNRNLQKEDILIFVQYKKSCVEFMPLSVAVKKQVSLQLGFESPVVIPIRRIPKTTSGKIQRYKLGEAYLNGEYATVLEELERLKESENGVLTVEPAKTEKEKVLVGVLKEVLRVEAIGVNHSFYEIGGNSINAVQIIDILKEHDYALNLEILVKAASIAEIAAQMNPYQAQTEKNSVQADEWLNSVPPQRNFYLLNHRDMGRINWWILSVLLLSRDGFEKQIVEKIFHELINYHPALKLKFLEREDELYMYSGPDYHPQVCVDEITIAGEEEIETVLFNESTVTYQAINLTQGPLLKIKLFHTPNGDFLLICIHHFVCDGASFVILIEDFATGYKQACQSQQIVFRKKTDSFQQWIQTIYQYSREPELLAELPYWSNMEKYSVIPLPKDNPDGTNAYGDMEKSALLFTVEDTQKVIAYSVKNNLKVEMLLSAGIGEAMEKWAGRNGILIEHTFNTRDCTLHGIDITRSVGWFSGSCPVLVDISKANSVAEKLNTVKNSYLSIPNNGLGYLILEQISCPQNPELKNFIIHPEILLIYNGEYKNESDRYGFEIPMIETGTWFDPELIRPNTFVIHSIIANNQLKISWEYSREQYKEETIVHILSLLEDFILEIIR